MFTRFDSPRRARSLTPVGCEFASARGVRILTPFAGLLDLPVVGPLVYKAEQRLADGPLQGLGGFYIAAYRKLGAPPQEGAHHGTDQGAR